MRLFLATLLLAVSTAQAQSVYTCRDKTGRVISSDRPIPECADRSVRETSSGGMLKREIAAPLTPEQQAQKDIDDKNRRIAEEAARERSRRDRALLAAYSNEDQIEQARRRALSDAEESLRGSQTRLAALNKDKASIADEIKGYNGKVPPITQRKADDIEVAIADESKALQVQQSEIGRINQRYDTELTRYRELSSQKRTK